MDTGSIQAIIPAAGVITVLGGAWLTVRKIVKDISKSKEAERAAILHAAKEEDSQVRIKLEAKIKALEVSLSNLEESVNKDIEHLKETYNGEIRNLGEKIEELRSDLKNQHGQLVQLLTEMIKNRD